MKKINKYFILLFLAISCKGVLSRQNLCSDFVLDIESNNYNIAIDLVKIKENLTKNLKLIKSNSSNNICNININLYSNIHSSFEDETGISFRENVEYEVNLKMDINKNNIINDRFRVFGYKNNTPHRISNYDNKLKTDVNTIISNEIFIKIKNNIDKIED